MINLDEKLKTEKKRYLNFVKMNKDKHLLIYGAGKQAKAVAQFFNENKIQFDGFCVTDLMVNKKEEQGKKIFQVDKIPFPKEEVAFAIGIRDALNDEIASILETNGYTNYLPSTGLIRYLGTYGYEIYTNPMIEITTKLGCAVNCKYCPQDVFLREYLKSGNPDKVLSFENFKICIDKVPQNVFIEFAGFTEPFFNPDCIKMIKYAKSKGHKVNIFTTLRGVTNDIVNELIKIQFEEFVVHIPDKENYAVIPVDEAYIGILHRLVSTKKPNGDNFIDYACAQGTVRDEVKTILGDNTRIYVVLNDRAGNLKDETLYSKKGICGHLRCELSQDINHNVMLPDGRIVLCANDWGMKHILGNLVYQSYDEIINGVEAQKIRRAMAYEGAGWVLCRNCFQAIKED